MRLREYRAAVRNRGFVLMLVGRSVSWFGNALAPMAVVFAVLDLGLSVSAVSVAVLARSVPQLAFVLVGGALADRPKPRRLLVLGSMVAACSQACLALLLVHGVATLGMIAALSAVNGASAALAGPAAGSLFRALVAEGDWHASSVLDRSGQQLGLMLGMSTGGVLIGWAGSGVAIAVDAATFVVATVCYLFMRPPAEIASRAQPRLTSQLAQGFGFLRQRLWLIAVMLQSLMTSVTVACCLQVIAAVVADATFGRAGLGVASSLQTAGALVGLLLAGVVPAARRLPGPILLGGLVGLPVLVLGVGPALLGGPLALLLVYAVSMLIMGAATGIAGVWRNLFMLQNVDADMMGRVTSYSLVASVGGLSLGEALAGPLTSFLGTHGALILVFVVVALVALWAATRREVRAVVYTVPDPVRS
ncbi:MAG TPA: MFS transporter [Microlunatus sp.]